MSHETIIQPSSIHGNGALRGELRRCLRTPGSQEEAGVGLASGPPWSGR
jgi:hypothetical protein